MSMVACESFGVVSCCLCGALWSGGGCEASSSLRRLLVALAAEAGADEAGWCF